MIVYSNVKSGFIDDVMNGDYVSKVTDSMVEKVHKNPSPAEINAFKNSLRAMKDVVEDNEIPNDCGIAIEYNIPTTNKRVDFIISGFDEHLGEDAIFVELKQWSSVAKIADMDQMIVPQVKTYVGGGLNAENHPSYQSWSYAELLRNTNSNVQKNQIKLFPCVYMHNYELSDENNQIFDPIYNDYLEKAPVFTMRDLFKLRDFIKKHIKHGDQLLALKTIETGTLLPSKSLQDCLCSMLKNNPEFIMIDEQKKVFEYAMKMARQSREDGHKRVLIVKGGPGTGKTVVAMNLLVKTMKESIFSSYVTKNSAPREVFKIKLKGEFRKSYIDNLFKSSGTFVNAPENAYGMLIVDEAHRLNAKSGMFSNSGENQIKEIINAARTSVFFIDEEQKVTSKDIGSVNEIRKWAKNAGAVGGELELTSQFRCNGSDGYLSWLDNTLGIRETANLDLAGADYDFKIFNDPKQLQDAIEEKNRTCGLSRMVAGYCWNWITKEMPDPDSNPDIVIGDFHMPWNLNASKPFAIAPSSIDQIGCIHTVQGLEFRYVGVIIGDDLRYSEGKVITDYSKRAQSDKSLNGLIGPAKAGNINALNACDAIIRNTYRTLMTRGLKGCYIYCTDKALSDYFRRCI